MSMIRSIIPMLVLVSIACYNLQAQVTITKQIGRVVFSGSDLDADSTVKESIAGYINNYLIEKHYSLNKRPLIYLAKSRAESPGYQLSYDNLDGNSLKNKLYDRKDKYAQPGIRIVFDLKAFNKFDIIKLLDYALNHLKELKNIRNQALKMDYYDQPDDLSLRAGELDSILRK